MLKAKKINVESSGFVPKIGQVRGRPLLLDNELDLKLRTMLITLRTTGAGINIHVLTGVLNGLVRTNPEMFGNYVDFQATRSWVRSLYREIKFSRRTVTTLRSIITRSLWVEVKSQFLYENSLKVLQYNIPDELFTNAEKTPSKFVATDNITMATRGAKHISRAGAIDKRVITVTLCEPLDGLMLPFLLIYTGKTERSIPNFTGGID